MKLLKLWICLFADVIGATPLIGADERIYLGANPNFIIIDEASKLMETFLLPVFAYFPHCRRFILVGETRQNRAHQGSLMAVKSYFRNKIYIFILITNKYIRIFLLFIPPYSFHLTWLCSYRRRQTKLCTSRQSYGGKIVTSANKVKVLVLSIGESMKNIFVCTTCIFFLFSLCYSRQRHQTIPGTSRQSHSSKLSLQQPKESFYSGTSFILWC